MTKCKCKEAKYCPCRQSRVPQLIFYVFGAGLLFSIFWEAFVKS